ncbi:hypothetical protein IVB03_23310 [Bradyrhizobium sp. 168]|uniref:hypothetical protein n=1 Tax=Bradyrhizobium sp. 168 TaxID=2782639 RepID=UPI001FF76ED7|nr:hypothetical protein [Bradyrhizobium sp. 168]MCK1582415.1 hypothetical protein [Bradyrhizobium sp. 168]
MRLRSLAGLLAFLLILAGVAIASWRSSLHSVAEYAALDEEAKAIAYTQDIVQAGTQPAAWDTRLFLPAGSLRDAARLLVGSEFSSQVANSDGALPAGAFVARLDSLKVETEASRLRPHLEITVGFRPAGGSTWWSGASVRFAVDAEFLPMVGANDTPAVLKIVPARIAPVTGLHFFDVAAGKLASEVLSHAVIERFAQQLAIPLPPLKIEFKLPVHLAVDQDLVFPFQGGYQLHAKFDGPDIKGSFEAPYPLMTASGVWLLGGAKVTFKTPDPLPVDRAAARSAIDLKRNQLAATLGAFDVAGNDVEVRLPVRPLLDAAKAVSGRQFAIPISTTRANGVIAEGNVLKDDFLGDAGVKVTPQHAEFVSGTLSANFAQPSWSPDKGLTVSVDVQAAVRAAIHYHLSTGKIGGGVGGDTTIERSTGGTLSSQIAVSRQETQKGTAIILQPELSCVRIAADIYSQAALVNVGWVKVGRIGVRVKRNVGGGRQSPVSLVDSLPRVYGLGAPQPNATGKPEGLRLPKPAVEIRWSPTSVVMENDGLRIQARLSMSGSDAQPGGPPDSDRSALADALREQSKEAPCAPEQELALLVDNAEIGPHNEIVKFLDDSVKAGIRVGQQTVDQINKLREKPIDTIKEAPGNIARETEKAGKWLGDRTGIHIHSPW